MHTAAYAVLDLPSTVAGYLFQNTVHHTVLKKACIAYKNALSAPRLVIYQQGALKRQYRAMTQPQKTLQSTANARAP